MKGKSVLFVAATVAIGLLIGPVTVSLSHGAVALEVLNPRGEIMPLKTVAPAPRVTDLAGKTIGIYWNEKSGGNNFWDVIEGVLKEKFPTTKIVRYRGSFDPGDAMAARMAKECDTFVYGVGD
jgi:hypothetical protein